MPSFRSRLVILAACVCLVCGCGPDRINLSAKERLFAAAPPSAKDLAKMKLQYYWTESVDLAVGESLRRMWRLDEKLYLLTSNNRLVALDAATGAFAWSCQVADVKKDVSPPATPTARPSQRSAAWRCCASPPSPGRRNPSTR